MIAQPINQDLLKRFGRFPSSSFKDSCSDTCEEVEHFPEVIRANRGATGWFIAGFALSKSAGKTVGATQAQDLLPQVRKKDVLFLLVKSVCQDAVHFLCLEQDFASFLLPT